MKLNLLASFRHWLAGVVLIGFFAGCSVFDPAEDIPSYLHIDGFVLSALTDQGSSSATITDAWVYMDGKLLGAYQLPCTIPILAEGTHSFIIRGGIKMNGLVATRAVYPYWKGWEGNVNLTRAQTTSIGTPTLNYFPGTDFVWISDFDGVGSNFIPGPDASFTAGIKIVRPPYSYEDSSAYIHLDADTTFFVGESSYHYSLPPQSDVYLEFDYKSDNEFTVGFVQPGAINSNPHLCLTITPTTTWKKIYVRLTDNLGIYNSGGNIDFNIYFAMSKDPNQAEAHLYLDNIKLLK